MSYTVTDWDLIQRYVFDDPATVQLIQDAIVASFEIAAIVVVIDIITGLPMAWILVRKQFRGKQFLDTLIDMPLAVPTAALGFSAAIFWAVSKPSAEAPWFAVGEISSPFILVLLLHVIFSYPYMVRSLAAILEQIDQTYETAGQTLGASKFTAARTITLPLFRAGLVTGIILAMARSLSETGGTMIALATMANSQNFQTGPTLIGTLKAGLNLNPDLAAPLAFISILLIAFSLVLLVALKLVVMKVRLPAGKVWPKWEKILSRGIAPKLKDGFSGAFLIIIVLIPSFFIFAYVFTATASQGDWQTFWESLANSFIIAGVVTLVDIFLGIPLALYIARNKKGRLPQFLDVMVNIPLIVPTAALGYSLGIFWGGAPFISAIPFLLVIFAHIAFTYPLVVRNVEGAVEEVDAAYEDTARTLGARRLQTFRKVLFPMIKASVLAGAIMAFTRSLGETGATIAVAGTSVNTAPVYIVELINGEQFYMAALTCIVLIVVSFAFMLALRFVTKKRRAG